MISLLRSLCIPSFCYYCHRYSDIQEPLCEICSSFSPILSSVLPIGLDDSLIVHALSVYEDPLKELLTKRFSRDYAFWVKMGTLLYKNYREYFNEGDLLIPIPDDAFSKRSCGFRKTAIMVRQISKLSGTTFADVLVYSSEKNRPFATTPDWYEYLKSSNESFVLPPHKRCILIDSNTLVTGATLSTFGRKLRMNTKKPIEGLVVCRINKAHFLEKMG